MQKTFLVVFFSLLMGFSAQAQVFVNGVNINDEDIAYCQIIGFNRIGLLNPARIWIDYGQPKFVVNPFNVPVISGPDRQKINFNSVIDALNFMMRNGWELVSSHVASDKDGDADTFVYLLRKRQTDR
jgi:hypothetical protein